MQEERERIKRIIKGGLSPEERRKSVSSPIVSRKLEQQWQTDQPEFVLNEINRRRILNRILNRIHTGHTGTSSRLRYLAYAVSITLLIGLGMWRVMESVETKTVYVRNSGRQSMDSFHLPDGSFVYLNAGSTLVYPEKFKGKNREIHLDGQAFFQVHPDKKHPFIVKTEEMNITALGTSFEVFNMKNASYIEMILSEGLVQVDIRGEGKEPSSFLVRPDEKLVYHNSGNIDIEAVNAKQYSAWRHGGKPTFRNEKLKMILPRLEGWYGEVIECEKELAEKYSFTFTIHNETLELLLDIFSASSPVRYLKTDNGYKIYEKNENVPNYPDP